MSGSIVIIRLQYQESGSGAGETRNTARSRWGLRLARLNLARRLQALGSLTSALVQGFAEPDGSLSEAFRGRSGSVWNLRHRDEPIEGMNAACAEKLRMRSVK